MGVSRTTVTEIYEAARYKLADSLVHGKRLLISGGHYCLCDGASPTCRRKECRRAAVSAESSFILRKEQIL